MNILTLLFLDGKEWIFILLAIVILFGGSKIPSLMKGLGTGIKDFKKAVKEDDQPSSTSEEKKDLN